MKAPTWVEKNLEVKTYKDKCMEMHQKKLQEIKHKGKKAKSHEAQPPMVTDKI